MRGSLNLCLLGAATSLVLSPRRLVPAMPKRGTDAERVAALLARGNDSGYTLSGVDTPLTPERFAAEILNLPGCRAWAYLSRPNDLRAASVLVPGNEKKPYTVEKAKGALRARAPRDDVLAGSSRTGNSSADRRAASTWEPNANASAGQRKRHRKQREIEAEEKKWSGTAQERLNTATFGSALALHRSASVTDWQHWNGVYPTTPGTPGFEPSFFYARKFKAMSRVLERETDEGMTVDDCLLDLYQGADREATINRGETAQACQCLATAGVITNDEIGQLVRTRRFFDQLEAPSKFESGLGGSRVFDGRLLHRSSSMPSAGRCSATRRSSSSTAPPPTPRPTPGSTFVRTTSSACGRRTLLEGTTSTS